MIQSRTGRREDRAASQPSPPRHSGWRRRPKWSTRASRLRAEMVVALGLCRTVAGAAGDRSTSCPSNSSPSSPSATRDQRRAVPRMHQLQLRCLITMNHLPRRQGIHRPGNSMCPSVYRQQSRHSGRSGWAATCVSSRARQAPGRWSPSIVEDLPVNGDGAGNIVHVAFG